jgi:hypothetical protein
MLRRQKEETTTGPSRRVSPYSVTSTGPEVHRGMRGAGPVFHQQSDKACAHSWFAPERCNHSGASLPAQPRRELLTPAW